MSREEIVSRVNRIMVEGFEVEPGLLSPDARLGDDLGLDSLDAVDLVVALEREFACRIREAEARRMRLLGDIYDHILQHARAAAEVAPQ